VTRHIPAAFSLLAACAWFAGWTLSAQSNVDTAAAHVEAARIAAGMDHTTVFDLLCRPASASAAPSTAVPAARPTGPPPRSQWHADPVRVFDNLFFVGQTEFSAWAVTTSEGIILVDTIFDYSVEDEVDKGLRTLGLDPTKIRYAIVSHGHGDHSGGAKYLQERFGTRIILSAADWDLLDRIGGTRPRRDLVATDGQTLTLGDTTLTMYLTPGHTLGTISTLIPVKDGGEPHLAAVWGGTMFNWTRNRAQYITAERTDEFWFRTYSASARRFRDIVAKAGADVLLSNHTAYDGSKTKLPALAKRAKGAPHPYVIGTGKVQSYLTTVNECAQAGLARRK
jgi:metallo-beta-lactamase class B